jgi:type II secretory ATPase GspE/PulE/Tfp pilus assembly ATPase PilB-like protein
MVKSAIPSCGSGRRRLLRVHENSTELSPRHRLPAQDHGEPRHRGTAKTAGRKDQIQDRREQGNRAARRHHPNRRLQRRRGHAYSGRERTAAGGQDGIFGAESARNQSIAEKPYGIILCVGPTGSGKTTTLHSVLGYINTPDIKIWTAEDPVEITQYGLRQVQVHSKIGFTFAAAMRAFLRADPDVIMVGEMRDKETADTGIEASLTGHLVLSTLHTNSAVETITRLLDMGCDSFSFADAMLGVLAQRLARRICKDCKEAYQPSKEEYEELRLGYGPDYWDTLGVPFDANFQALSGQGLRHLQSDRAEGPRGATRTASGHGSHEEVDSKQSETDEMLKAGMAEGMTTLVQDGIQKVLQGHTTYKEVKAVAIK